MKNALLAEDSRQSHLEARQQRRGQHIAVLARELCRATEPVAVPSIDAYSIDLRIHDPVFSHAGTLVETAFERSPEE